jgi:uncharacterized phage protein (TIGR01671 family)
MKREIKFRGKDYAGEWWYGSLSVRRKSVNGDTAEVYAIFTIDDVGFSVVKHESVGQYTGLRDTNGKEIYEGDIIECLGSKGDPIRHQVLYSDERGCLCQYGTKYEAWNDGYIDCGAITQSYIIEHEKYVIGNIHDNPELLKK